MENKCYYRINIDTTNALKQDLIKDRFGKYSVETFTENVRDLFNKEWMEQLEENVGEIRTVLIFSRPPFYSTDLAHVDLTSILTPVWFSLNWTLTGKSSFMVWHEPPENHLEIKNVRTTMSNNLFLRWPADSLPIIDRVEVTDQMVLVRTDIPHSITVDSEPRISIAVRPTASGKVGYSWEKAVEFYRNKNLLIEN